MSEVVTSRRRFLQSALAGGAAAVLPAWAHDVRHQPKLPVAGVVTVYKRGSHADVILGKILEGYDQQGGIGPGLELAALYIDQPASSAMGIELAKRFKVPVFDSIEGAVTVGQSSIPVRGVISIGEHGDYPKHPKTGQIQYPRRRFFDEIVAAFRKHGSSVPVFNDKHLGYAWADAKHMVDTARTVKFPLMAGSSIPVAWRRPEFILDRGARIRDAVGIGYGGPEAYGFHALEGLQCMVERRFGGESGVKSVRAITGEAIWNAERAGEWNRELLEAAMAAQPAVRKGRIEDNLKPDSPFYLIEYRDGLRATLAMMNGVCHQFGFAARLEDKSKAATWIELDERAPYGHFAWLLKGIEHMIHHGRAPYPVERTLLTTGILDRAMHSLAEGGRRLDTPELDLRYQSADWGHAKGKLPGN